MFVYIFNLSRKYEKYLSKLETIIAKGKKENFSQLKKILIV